MSEESCPLQYPSNIYKIASFKVHVQVVPKKAASYNIQEIS
jgi:hypothetical protein